MDKIEEVKKLLWILDSKHNVSVSKTKENIDYIADEIVKLFCQPVVSSSSISTHDVQWVVNDNAELGVKIGGKFFWLYKGESLEYKDKKHDDGTPIKYRQVGKREFGECCHPLHLQRLPERYTEGDGWQEC